MLCPSFDYGSVRSSDRWERWEEDVQSENDDDDESLPMYETRLEKFFAVYQRDWKNQRLRVSALTLSVWWLLTNNSLAK